jgi:hypothetical protein
MQDTTWQQPSLVTLYSPQIPHGTQCGIWGEQSGTGTGLSQSISVFPYRLNLTSAPYSNSHNRHQRYKVNVLPVLLHKAQNTLHISIAKRNVRFCKIYSEEIKIFRSCLQNSVTVPSYPSQRNSAQATLYAAETDTCRSRGIYLTFYT